VQCIALGYWRHGNTTCRGMRCSDPNAHSCLRIQSCARSARDPSCLPLASSLPATLAPSRPAPPAGCPPVPSPVPSPPVWGGGCGKPAPPFFLPLHTRRLRTVSPKTNIYRSRYVTKRKTAMTSRGFSVWLLLMLLTP
jgi:hypothetical protein